MSNYQTLVSSLQSRLAVRANAIKSATEWKHYHRALQQMQDWRDTKAVLKHLTNDQIVDKKLLKVMQELAYCDDMMNDRGSFVKYLCEVD